jgi:hypothetical protein
VFGPRFSVFGVRSSVFGIRISVVDTGTILSPPIDVGQGVNPAFAAQMWRGAILSPAERGRAREGACSAPPPKCRAGVPHPAIDRRSIAAARMSKAGAGGEGRVWDAPGVRPVGPEHRADCAG